MQVPEDKPILTDDSKYVKVSKELDFTQKSSGFSLLAQFGKLKDEGLYSFVTGHSQGDHIHGRGKSSVSSNSIQLLCHNMFFTPGWLNATAGI